MLPQEVIDASDDELETELHRCRGSQDAGSRQLVPLIQQELAERQGMADFMRQLDNMQLGEGPCWLEPAQQHVHLGGGGQHAAEDSVPEQQQQEHHHVPPAGAQAVPAVTGTGFDYAQGTTEQLLLLSTAQQRSQCPDRLWQGDSSAIGQCSTAAGQADACLAHADAQVGALPSCALPSSGLSRQQEPDRRSKAPAGEAVAGAEPAESSPVSVLDAAIEAYKAERWQLKKVRCRVCLKLACQISLSGCSQETQRLRQAARHDTLVGMLWQSPSTFQASVTARSRCTVSTGCRSVACTPCRQLLLSAAAHGAFARRRSRLSSLVSRVPVCGLAGRPHVR